MSNELVERAIARAESIESVTKFGNYGYASASDAATLRELVSALTAARTEAMGEAAKIADDMVAAKFAASQKYLEEGHIDRSVDCHKQGVFGQRIVAVLRGDALPSPPVSQEDDVQNAHRVATEAIRRGE
jgi:hypothetical protein